MSNVFGALLYLRLTSLRNMLVLRFKRLKQPKYLIGAVVGVAYIYFVFFRRMRLSRGRGAPIDLQHLPPDVLAMILSLGALIALIIFALCWILPRDRAALNFREAEIAFLFPAPVSRRTLVHYRLIGAQTGLLFTALMITFFSSGASFLPGNVWIRIAGWWIFFATLSLHVIASSFVLTRLLDSGITSRLRQLLVFGIVVIGVAALFFWLRSEVHAPTAEDMDGFPAFAHYASNILASGLLPWLLLPAKWLVGPLFAADGHSFLVAVVPALFLYALHYLWVLIAEVSFEEASIAKAEKRAAKLAALRDGKLRQPKASTKGRKAPFNLAATPRPEFAFLWKNLLSTAESLKLRNALIAAVLIFIGSRWFDSHRNFFGLQYSIAIFSLIACGYLLLLGPQFARQDLRGDLPNADMLKIYPLRGWQIVFGEILTPTAVITVLIWLALLMAALLFNPRRMEWLTPQLRVSVALGLAFITPLLCAMQLLVVNAAAVLFPAWLLTTRNRASPGIEVMGQRIFFLAGQLFVVLVALLPASIAAAAIFVATSWMVGVPLSIAAASVVVIGILAAEVAGGIWWLGQRFERFDLSAELRL